MVEEAIKAESNFILGEILRLLKDAKKKGLTLDEVIEAFEARVNN